MKWIKKGLIFKPNGEYDWMVSHAQLCTVDVIEGNLVRIYFNTRDKQGRSNIGFVDVNLDEPQKILNISREPILKLGDIGTFDDNGIMISCIVNYKGHKYLYYVGWNPQITVSYRLSIGLAVSDDNGETFKKISRGPIYDRSIDEPYFTSTPYVLIDDGVWKMWYASCTGWKIINKHPEPSYYIKYTESSDGIRWDKTGSVCIDYDDFTRAVSRPYVFREDNLYKMLYSFRSDTDYRIDSTKSYRLGYAESPDGIRWERKDNEAGIECSENDWDSEMIAYPYLHKTDTDTYLFYNGNGFGKTGLGYAMKEKE